MSSVIRRYDGNLHKNLENPTNIHITSYCQKLESTLNIFAASIFIGFYRNIFEIHAKKF